jgi:hypothetical protein
VMPFKSKAANSLVPGPQGQGLRLSLPEPVLAAQ